MEEKKKDKFVVVFSKEDAAKLIEDGFDFIKSDTSENLFVFLNEVPKGKKLVFRKIQYSTTNVLTF